MRSVSWILTNLLIVLPAIVATLLESREPDLYYRVIQEDHWMEWSTVWAFLIAAFIAGRGATRTWRERGRLPWFYAGLALFTFLVAMEEISWGQRLFNFTPPEYFLADNFQQELNVHNIIASDLRQFGFLMVVIGYGVFLPMLGLVRPVTRLYERFGVMPPPAPLVPAFAATAVFYMAYPVEFTGEWAELMLGFGMATSVAWQAFGKPFPAKPEPAMVAVTANVAATVLGLVTMQATVAVRSHSEVLLRAVEVEIRSLKADFEHDRVRTRCGVHKRVYTFRVEYGQSYLTEGAFASLEAGGLDDKRARYFLDPWNMPYWIRHRCSDGQEISFIYSFGPNRRRDSTPMQILGDDVGAYISTTE